MSPRYPRPDGPVAQGIEHRSPKAGVARSNRAGAAEPLESLGDLDTALSMALAVFDQVAVIDPAVLVYLPYLPGFRVGLSVLAVAELGDHLRQREHPS